MPITVHAYSSLDNSEIRDQLERLYDTSPEFGDGHDAIEQLEQDLQQYTTLYTCLLYTSPSPRDRQKSRMPSSA